VSLPFLKTLSRVVINHEKRADYYYPDCCPAVRSLVLLPYALKGKASQLVKSQCDRYLLAKVDFDGLSVSVLKHLPQLTLTLDGLSIAGVDTFRRIRWSEPERSV
jgi:hypothetical protein